jgi:hypothetical protein
VIRGPVRQGLNGAGRLVLSAGYETAAIYDEKIWNVVRAVVLVNDGALGIIPHAACTHQMPRRGGRVSIPPPPKEPRFGSES